MDNTTKITIIVGETGVDYLKEILEAAKKSYKKTYKKEYSSDKNPSLKLYVDTLTYGADALIDSIGGEITLNEEDFDKRTIKNVLDALTEPFAVLVGRKAAATIAAQAES